MAHLPSKTSVLHLAILGGFIAEGLNGRPVNITSKKNRALLAILALSAQLSAGRDRLANLLWSDRDDAHARSSLRQSIALLRKEVGEATLAAVIIADEAISLVADRVEVDALEFLQLAQATDAVSLRRAAELYRGELLAGLSISDPAFDDWLTGERARFGEIAIRALDRLVLLERGPAQIATAQRLLALDQLREASHRALMQAYANNGENGLALKQFEICKGLLRKELDAEPARETQDLRKDIAAITSQPAVEFPSGKPKWDKPAIAVLPFANLSGDPQQQYFSDGITNDLIAELSRFGGLLVIASHSVFTYQDKAIDVRQVSRELEVGYVLEGSVQRDGGRVRINAQLIDATNNVHLWAKRYDRQASSIFAIQDELVEAIVTELAVKLDLVERGRASRKMPESLTAYDLWLRANDLINRATKDDNAAARRLLEQAVKLDPVDARYTVGLAWTHVYDARWGWGGSQEVSLRTAEELARKAVRLDDADYRTHWVLGEVLQGKAEFDAAQAAYERAFALNPRDADLLAHYGDSHVYAGQLTKAIERIESAMRLNPFSPDWYLRLLGIAYFCNGDYQKVIDTIHKARQLHPALFRLLAAAHIMLQQPKQAEAARDEVMRLEPWFTISALRRGLPFLDGNLGESYFLALRKAGLPE
jgi:TolB-like protein/cytochrome c-type biogenesis protein CcmH/NrfG